MSSFIGRDREWQTYGLDARGLITHAGVHQARRASLKVARRLQRKWAVWKEIRLRARPGQYPLAGWDTTVAFCMWPVGKPEEQQTFVLKGN